MVLKSLRKLLPDGFWNLIYAVIALVADMFRSNLSGSEELIVFHPSPLPQFPLLCLLLIHLSDLQ
jgi:hypothetical protein